MELKPVKEKQTPKYPLKENVPAQTLKELPPQRWTKNAAAKVALGTLAVMSLAGCTPYAGVPLPPEMATEETASMDTAQPTVTYEQTAGVPAPGETPVVETVTVGEPAMPTVSVAPLFVHGDGMGAFGCVMVAPPVFLTEDEALAVINDVAKDYGLAFTAEDSLEFTNVLQPSVNIMEPENTSPPDTITTLRPDFMDAAHNVAIEFVSVEDVKGWTKEGSAVSSVEQYDTKDAAAQLSDALDDAASSSDVTAGVLYDPCEFSEDSQAKTRALSVEQLKNQAKDFFDWLKAQGVI